MQKNEAQAGLTNSLHSFQDGTDQDSEVAKKMATETVNPRERFPQWQKVTPLELSTKPAE